MPYVNGSNVIEHISIKANSDITIGRLAGLFATNFNGYAIMQKKRLVPTIP